MTVVPLRPATLGGSTAAAACGIDPYTSRVALWNELTGRTVRKATEAMEWGTLLEPVIRQRLEADGHELMPAPDGLQDPERDWLVGHPDGFVSLDGERAVLEVKTASHWAIRAWDADVPLHYAAQVQVYLHLTGLRKALLAVLVGGQRLELHELTRHDWSIGALLDGMERFRWHVVTDTPPAPDGSDSAREAVAAMFPEHAPGRVVRLDARDMERLRDLRARKAQADVLDRQITALENRLKVSMGDAAVAITPTDDEAIRWTTSTRRTVDTTRLRRDRPEIAAEYEKESTTRRFTLL